MSGMNSGRTSTRGRLISLPLDIVSRHRNAIYGLSIFWIVIFHARAIDKVRLLVDEPGFGWLDRLIATGNVGVDIFLFLSGISLYYSFHRNPQVKRFFRKRLTRVVPAAWLIYIIWWTVTCLVWQFDPLGLLSRLTLMRFWLTGDESIWFVSLILLLYLVYPLVYKWLYSWERGVVLRALFAVACSVAVVFALQQLAPDYYDKVEIALTRVPVFLVGCAFGKPVFEGRRVSWLWGALAVAGAVLFFAVVDMKLLTGMLRRFLSGFGGVCLTYALALFFEACVRVTKNENLGLIRFFVWLGGFSLELYLSHIMLNQVLRKAPFYVEGDAVQYCAMAVLAIGLAWLVKWLLDTAMRARSAKAT